jgi:hypothetical protein
MPTDPKADDNIGGAAAGPTPHGINIDFGFIEPGALQRLAQLARGEGPTQ